MNIEFNELFTSPRIQEKLSSEQFKLSEILLDKRYDLNLNFAKVAEIVGLSTDEYIKYEYGSPDIPVDDYHKAIKKIEKYEKQQTQIKITLDESKYIVTSSQNLHYDSNKQSGNFDSQELFIVEAA